ncbi:UNVERIFIED_CONTAM: hypothetical protein Slati_2742000 [Sesamum latifolium]|uniref:Uncharacterized protein n=1 Tax=Sesamum latifolium TaxID=2727402 RepID=A0AAW2VXF3_9LAMI
MEGHYGDGLCEGSVEGCLSTDGRWTRIRDIQALNYSLMCRRLWDIVVERSDSIWVKWIRHYRLCNSSVWTVNIRVGSWAWRKLIRLRILIEPHVEYLVGDGHSFSLWHDPWHCLGPLIIDFLGDPSSRVREPKMH